MAFDLRLALQGVVALLTGLVYAYVARLVIVRDLPAEAHRANVAFATWWWAFGAVEFLAGAYTLPAAFGVRDLALAVTMLNTLLLLVAVALGALVYFLVYLYTGSRRALWPIVFLYGVLALGLLYLIAWMQPTGFDESMGAASIAYTRELEGGAAIAFGLVLSGPVILAALGYGSLFFRTHERPQRFRIAVVALSFLGWFGWSAASTMLRLGDRYGEATWLIALNSAILLGVPLFIAMAYRPPRWLASRIAGDEAAARSP